jgi:hypothetical protein
LKGENTKLKEKEQILTISLSKVETRIGAMEEERRAWVTDKDMQLETAAKEAR